jgi:hypothetical protein
MRRQPHTSGPPEWMIHSTFVRRRDGHGRLEQAFEILLGSPTHPRINGSYPDRSADYESRDLRPGLDRQAGTGSDD